MSATEQVLALGGAALAVSLLVWQLRDLTRVGQRQRKAEALVRAGCDARTAASQVAMPWLQAHVFVASHRAAVKLMRALQTPRSSAPGRPISLQHRFELTLRTGDVLAVPGARSLDDALAKSGVHPDNVASGRHLDEE